MRVVLQRPVATGAARWLGLTGSARVVPEWRTLRSAEGVFALTPWVDGEDVDALLLRHPEGLPHGLACAIAREVARALDEARGPDGERVGHGALRNAVVRVSDGVVRVLGFRGVSGDDDLPTLAALLDDWLGDADEVLRDGIAAAWTDAGSDPAALAVALSPFACAEVVLPGQPSAPALREHALVGREIAEAAAALATPPKVQVAAVAAVTLVLGLVSGLLLAGAW